MNKIKKFLKKLKWISEDLYLSYWCKKHRNKYKVGNPINFKGSTKEWRIAGLNDYDQKDGMYFSCFSVLITNPTTSIVHEVSPLKLSIPR